MGEPKTNPHFDGFRTLGRVLGSQKQLFLFFKTPGYLAKSRQIHGAFFKGMILCKSHFMEIPNTVFGGKDAARKVVKIRLIIV